MSELFEELAAIEHERWSDWQKYVHSLCSGGENGELIIPASRVQHWNRQIKLAYIDLSENEKEMDRDQVRKYWHLIERLTTRNKVLERELQYAHEVAGCEAGNCKSGGFECDIAAAQKEKT